MTTTQLETYVKDQFNMELYEFIKHKVEVGNLYDYELAGILNVNRAFIGKLRKTFGMKKSKQLELLIKIKEKMESLGLNLHLRIQKHSFEILTNDYKLLLRYASTTVMIGKKQYFHITTGAGPADIDFIICLCRNNGKSIHYVIPRHVMPKYGVYLFPEARPAESKYARFKEAWHLLTQKKTHKGGIMRAKESKQLFEESDISAVRSVKRSDVQPGRINLGSHLNQRNSLSARVKTEIDRYLHPCR